MKKLVIANPHGFCGGVRRALEKIDEALNISPTVYVLHELVHNNFITNQLIERGVVFVKDINDIPVNSVVLIGAHGVPEDIENKLLENAKTVIDATCPLVNKLHNAAAALNQNQDLILLGKPDHPEAIGIIGHSHAGRNFIISSLQDIDVLPALRTPVALSQTTFDFELTAILVSALRNRFPDLEFHADVCTASSERQHAVIKVAKQVEHMIILGSSHSSNANRLSEVAQRHGITADLADSIEQLNETSLKKYSTIGLSSGASTPEQFIEAAIKKLQSHGFTIQPVSPNN